MPIRQRSNNNINDVTTTMKEKDQGDSDSPYSSSPTNSCGSYTKLDKPQQVDEEQENTVKSTSFTATELCIPTTNKASLSSKMQVIQQQIQCFLSGYSAFTSSVWSQDKVLKVIQFSLIILSRFYTGPGRTDSKTTWSSTGSSRDIGDSLRKLGFQIGWARYVTRLLGLPMSIEAISSGAFGPGLLGKLMALSMVGYYPLEHLAWAKWQAPTLRFMPMRKKSNQQYVARDESRLAGLASAWSCRFWFAYVIVDTIRSTVALKELAVEPQKEAATGTEDAALTNDPLQPQQPLVAEKDFEDAKLALARKSERLQIVRNACFLLPLIHWSLPHWDTDPWLDDDLVQFLMWLESVVCLYQGVSNFRGVPPPLPPSLVSSKEE
jgi:hypothetical protein